MLVEVARYYKQTMCGNGVYVPELSAPKHEVSDAMATKMMSMLEETGLKRCENSSQYFYTDVEDCHNYTEFIFYK